MLSILLRPVKNLQYIFATRSLDFLLSGVLHNLEQVIPQFQKSMNSVGIGNSNWHSYFFIEEVGWMNTNNLGQCSVKPKNKVWRPRMNWPYQNIYHNFKPLNNFPTHDHFFYINVWIFEKRIFSTSVNMKHQINTSSQSKQNKIWYTLDWCSLTFAPFYLKNELVNS